ncbi:acetyl-CoA C-acetyltransferase [Candidatus Thioglobus sp.]|jgi:acetyl-CoA C-acetyltransferase|nr:acetyl-CoA C-acetyltransferase [Candidatus Thioglobus sp.]
MNHEIVIVAATRTALGSFGGSLSSIPAHKLGAEVIASLLKKTGVNKDQIDEVILGQVLTAGSGQNPARQASIEAGLPYQTPSMTINKVCGSGLKAVQLAFQAIACGDAEIIIAGGQESMSLSSHVLPKSREGKKMGPWAMVDTMVVDGLWCAFNDCHMGVTAENIATKFDYSRQSQDEFALESQQKTEAAQKSDLFRDEITPISIPQRRGDDIIFDSDEFPRHSTSIDSLANLRPAFAKDGTVTAGNASGINDGAAVVMVMSASKAQELKLEPMARIVSYSSAGVDPSIMGTGPIPASAKCLEKAGWKVSELDRIEANEAFAAQAMSVNDSLGWDKSKVNVTGGSISLGHPIGASGARILVTLLHGMERDKVNKGLATMCIGGGMGVAIAVERIR